MRDAGSHRIGGFPYLRVDRFLASFRGEVAGSEPAFSEWAARLAAIDAAARAAELSSLSETALASLPAPTRDAAATRTRGCREQLMTLDLSRPERRSMLVQRAHVPDHYATWKRVVGLYALTSVPFYGGVERWQAQASAAFERNADAVGGSRERYVPAGEPVAAERVGEIVAGATRDALGMPRLSEDERDALLRAYAPAFEIEVSGAYDRFGPLAWRDGATPQVDVSHPLAYRRLAYTRYHGRVLLQLVYTIWFPERPIQGGTDLLGGKLDGVVWRVTLDEQGRALVYDTIHPCGCYHTFIPTARVEPVPPPERGIEWAFVPLRLPALAAAQRVSVRIATRTHYVIGVRPDDDADGIHYGFAEDDELRVLPRPDGATRSAFNCQGIVPGTQRGERWLFWPMGIAEPGAMRRWGTHATAFVGRRHFDDADLIERRFAPVPARAGQ